MHDEKWHTIGNFTRIWNCCIHNLRTCQSRGKRLLNCLAVFLNFISLHFPCEKKGRSSCFKQQRMVLRNLTVLERSLINAKSRHCSFRLDQKIFQNIWTKLRQQSTLRRLELWSVRKKKNSEPLCCTLPKCTSATMSKICLCISCEEIFQDCTYTKNGEGVKLIVKTITDTGLRVSLQ